MNSKIVGRNYAFWNPGDKTPEKLNKSKTDKSLERLSKAFATIEEELQSVYYGNEGLYNILASYFDNAGMEMDDEKASWRLRHVHDSIDELKASLAEHDDELPDEERLLELSDFGFKPGRFSHREHDYYMKVLEDTDEKEVVEEIIVRKDPIRRVRTTIWEKNTPY